MEVYRASGHMALIRFLRKKSSLEERAGKRAPLRGERHQDPRAGAISDPASFMRLFFGGDHAGDLLYTVQDTLHEHTVSSIQIVLDTQCRDVLRSPIP